VTESTESFAADEPSAEAPATNGGARSRPEEEICHWAVLYDIAALTSAKSFDLERAASSVLEVAIKLAGGDAGVVLLQEKANQDLIVHSAVNVDADAVLEDAAILDAVQEAIREGRAATRETAVPHLALGGARSFIALPLRVRLRVPEKVPRERRRYQQPLLVKPLGAILVARATGSHQLASDRVRALETFAAHAAEVLVNARLYHRATRDPLTEFFQRRELEQHLAVELTLAEHANAPLSLLMVTIDGLGLLSERLGHARAEKVIERVAKMIQTQVRHEDACIRYGGEEFALVLPSTDEAGARVLAEKILRTVAEYPGFGKGIDVTLSIGIAVFPYHATAREELIRKADQTLFIARTEGGNKVLPWHKGIPKYALRSDKLLGIITGNQAKDYRNVMMLLDTVVVVNSLLERKHVLGTLLDMMIQLAAAERGVLLLEKNGVLRPEVAQDEHRNTVEPTNICEEVVARVRKDSIPLLVQAEAPSPDEEALAEAVRRQGLERVICVPLSVKGEDIGCMYFDVQAGARGLGEFAETDLIFFQALAREIGSALEHARLYEENVKQKLEVEKLNAQLAKKVEAQAEELEVLEQTLEGLKLKYNYDRIIGKSQPIQKVFKLLDRITDSDVAVLIQGETGTGKELVAKALHFNGPRKDRPFVSVNCSAISESLMESELFGHVKGSFTGADADKKGLFEQADGGTIFLDEVQDMSRGMQRELLRVIQEQEIRRVGGKETIKINVRVISATNRDLKDLVKRGEFREDLYYRLNVVFIELPPLRDRKEDVPLIISRLLEDMKSGPDGKEIKLEKAAMRALLKHDWPGNVRELQNWLEKTCLMLEGDTIRETDVRLEPGEQGSGSGGVSSLFDSDYKNAKEAFLREYLKAVLARNQGNVTRAAQEAGIVRSSFHKMMRKHTLRARDFGAR
jgi:diguanylate cyclase (GGDEF)-like protein